MRQVTWEYEKIKLLNRDKKVAMTGYETLAGEINVVMKTLTDKSAPVRVTKSALGCYLGLPDYNTWSDCMIHYVVCHQVVPKPNFDPTALFFRIGNTVIRFSRVEYALVSGLKFGATSFNPYARHKLPRNIFCWGNYNLVFYFGGTNSGLIIYGTPSTSFLCI